MQQRFHSIMQECCRIDQTCPFIHYPISDRHTIISITEMVILFLITLANKGKKQRFPDDRFSEAKLRFASAARYREFFI